MRDTSLQAYREIQPCLGGMEQTVLVAINAYPNLTDSELTEKMGYGKNTNRVRPRRNRLVTLGLVESAGKRRCTITKKHCHTWRIKPHA
jgi:hypothetical protein